LKEYARELPVDGETGLFDNARWDFWHWSKVIHIREAYQESELPNTTHVHVPHGLTREDALKTERHADRGGAVRDDVSLLGDALGSNHVMIMTHLVHPSSWDVAAFRSPHPGLRPGVRLQSRFGPDAVAAWMEEAERECEVERASWSCQDAPYSLDHEDYSVELRANS